MTATRLRTHAITAARLLCRVCTQPARGLGLCLDCIAMRDRARERIGCDCAGCDRALRRAVTR